MDLVRIGKKRENSVSIINLIYPSLSTLTDPELPTYQHIHLASPSPNHLSIIHLRTPQYPITRREDRWVWKAFILKDELKVEKD